MSKTEEQIVREYAEQLDALTSSKESIMKSSKFALENPAFHDQLFSMIVSRLEQTPASAFKKRIPLFYLVDSICQNAKLKQRAEYLAITNRYLPYMVGLLLRNCDARDREKAATTFKKVLAIWEQRSVLDAAVIKDFVARLDAGDDFAVPKPASLKRGADAASTEDKLKAIEEYRRESKRLRWENSLRPADDNEYAQLNELWDKVEPVDVSSKSGPAASRSPSSSVSPPNAASPSVRTTSSPARSPPRATRPVPAGRRTASGADSTPDSNIREESMVESPGSSPVALRRSASDSDSRPATTGPVAPAVHPALLAMQGQPAAGQFAPPTSASFGPAPGSLPEPYGFQQHMQHQQLLQQQMQQQMQPPSLHPPSMLPPRSLPGVYGDGSYAPPGQIAPPHALPGSMYPPTSLNPLHLQPPGSRSMPFNATGPESALLPTPPVAGPPLQTLGGTVLPVSVPIGVAAAAAHRADQFTPRGAPAGLLPTAPPFASAPVGAGGAALLPPMPPSGPVVLVWDLDETLIVYNYLFTPSYAQSHRKDPFIGRTLGERMTQLIMKVMRQLGAPQLEQLERVSVPNDFADLRHPQLDSVAIARPIPSTMAQMSMNMVSQLYAAAASDGGVLGWETRQEIESLHKDIDAYTDGWLSLGRRALMHTRAKHNDYVNIVVTSGQLIPTIAKMIIYKLNDLVPVQNVYSSRSVGKRWCFRKLRVMDFPTYRFCVVGDGQEEEITSKQENMPFYKITDLIDLQTLYQKLYGGPDVLFSGVL